MRRMVSPAGTYAGQKKAALRLANAELAKMSDGETRVLKGASVAYRAVRVHKGYHSGPKQFAEKHNNLDSIQYAKKNGDLTNTLSKGPSGMWERTSPSLSAFPQEKLPSNASWHMNSSIGRAGVSQLGGGASTKKGSSGHSGG